MISFYLFVVNSPFLFPFHHSFLVPQGDRDQDQGAHGDKTGPHVVQGPIHIPGQFSQVLSVHPCDVAHAPKGFPGHTLLPLPSGQQLVLCFQYPPLSKHSRSSCMVQKPLTQQAPSRGSWISVTYTRSFLLHFLSRLEPFL